MQTNHNADTVHIKITPNDKGNPAGKLADAEVTPSAIGTKPTYCSRMTGWDRHGGNRTLDFVFGRVRFSQSNAPSDRVEVTTSVNRRGAEPGDRGPKALGVI